MLQVAALYVDTENGPYADIAGVDCWNQQRDARLFSGGMPVVAHPPCGAWGRLRHCVQFTPQTKHDKRLAPIAVEQVKAHGGVLEHPQHSDLWRYCNLPRPYKQIPSEFIPCHNEPLVWSLQINQCDFGHKSQKPTWLLFAGIRPKDLPPLPSDDRKTHCPVPFEKIRHSDRHLTPKRLAEWLVAAARKIDPSLVQG